MKSHRRGHAGVTLLEVLVAAAILAMMGTMIYTAFEHTSRIGRRLAGRQERDHVARIALNRLMKDLRSAYLSAHVNPDPTFLASRTAFVGVDQSPGDRLDFTTFTHERMVRGTHEGDECEVGYRVEARRGPNSVYDLLRRESPRVDNDPLRGGTVDVLVPDVVSFNLRYYDPVQDTWVDGWDSTQAAGQTNRLPSRIRATLVLRDTDGRERRYMSETSPMIPEVLRFGLPIDYH
jgi:general secretion pathway protein J